MDGPAPRIERKAKRCGSGRADSTSAGLTAAERASSVVSELTASPEFWGLSNNARGLMRRTIEQALLTHKE